MTFISQEESVESGSPIELYRFSNLEDTFTYTSADVPVVFNSQTYEPNEISRTEDRAETLDEQRRLVVKLPASDPFVRRYIPTLPAQQDTLTVYKQHSTDGGSPETVVLFKGKVTNVAIEGVEALVNVLPESSVLQRTIPAQTCRNLCNHVLYDFRCKVAESQFRLDAEITAISSDGLTITVDGGSNVVPFTGLTLSAQLTSDVAFFNGGSLERGTLERRMIRESTDLGGNTADLVVLLPFTTISVGSSFQLLAGCDHQFPTCRDKFDNEENYGGFPYVPRKNPFLVGVDI